MIRFRILISCCLTTAVVMFVGCSASADGPAAATTSGKPVGFYFMTRYWSYTRTLEKAAWYFAPDGTVYENLETGFSPEDLAAHKGRKGKLQLVGSDVQVTWSDGKISKSNFQREKSGFAWDGGIFTPVQVVADKKKIVGVYDGGESLTRRGDWASIAKKLTLNADGTYRLEGVAFVKSETKDFELAASSDKTTTGTWDVSGYSLKLKEAGGKTVRQITFPFDDDSTPIYPDHLFVGGTLYKKLQ